MNWGQVYSKGTCHVRFCVFSDQSTDPVSRIHGSSPSLVQVPFVWKIYPGLSQPEN